MPVVPTIGATPAARATWALPKAASGAVKIDHHRRPGQGAGEVVAQVDLGCHAHIRLSRHRR